MDQTRVIEVKKNILAANDEAADAFRAERAQEGTFFVDVMASPGAGKTTLLLALIKELRARGVEALGVIEADLESDVDAQKIKEAGVASAVWRGVPVIDLERYVFWAGGCAPARSRRARHRRRGPDLRTPGVHVVLPALRPAPRGRTIATGFGCRGCSW